MRSAIIAACLLIPCAAQAQQMSLTAISGKPLKLNFSNATNPDCSNVGEVVVRLTKQPEHGRVAIAKASDFPSFEKKNARHACNKKRVTGTRTEYVSERGYTGADSAAIEIIFPTGATARRTYRIDVR